MIATGTHDQPIRAAIVADVDEELRRALTGDARFLVREVDARTADQILEAARDAHLLVTRHHNKLDATLLGQLPHLRVVAQATSGIDNIDTSETGRRGIRIVNTPGSNANAVAEYVIGQIIAISRTLPFYDSEVRGGRWFRADCAARHELSHYRLGIVGVGNVGSRVATLARLLGMTVCGYDPYVGQPVFDHLGMQRYGSLDELLEVSNTISLHVPLTEETMSMIGGAEIGRLASGSILINASRGEVLDFDALIDALESGHLAGAACDVFDPEPPRFSRALPPNLLITPHIAGCTAEAKREAGARLYRLILEALDLSAPVR